MMSQNVFEGRWTNVYIDHDPIVELFAFTVGPFAPNVTSHLDLSKL